MTRSTVNGLTSAMLKHAFVVALLWVAVKGCGVLTELVNHFHDDGIDTLVDFWLPELTDPEFTKSMSRSTMVIPDLTECRRRLRWHEQLPKYCPNTYLYDNAFPPPLITPKGNMLTSTKNPEMDPPFDDDFEYEYTKRARINGTSANEFLSKNRNARDERSGNYGEFSQAEDKWAMGIIKSLSNDMPMSRYMRRHLELYFKMAMQGTGEFDECSEKVVASRIRNLQAILQKDSSGYELLSEFWGNSDQKETQDCIMVFNYFQTAPGWRWWWIMRSKAPYFDNSDPGGDRYRRRGGYRRRNRDFGLSAAEFTLLEHKDLLPKECSHAKDKVVLDDRAFGKRQQYYMGSPVIAGAAGTLQTIGGIISFGSYLLSPHFRNELSLREAAEFRTMTSPKCSEILMVVYMSYLMGLGHHSFTETLEVAQGMGNFAYIPDVSRYYENAFSTMSAAFVPEMLASNIPYCTVRQEQHLRVLSFNLELTGEHRTKNELRKIGFDDPIETVSAIIDARMPDIAAFHNVGKNHGKVLREFLQRHGIPVHRQSARSATSLDPNYKVLIGKRPQGMSATAEQQYVYNILAIKSELFKTSLIITKEGSILAKLSKSGSSFTVLMASSAKDACQLYSAVRKTAGWEQSNEWIVTGMFGALSDDKAVAEMSCLGDHGFHEDCISKSESMDQLEFFESFMKPKDVFDGDVRLLVKNRIRSHGGSVLKSIHGSEVHVWTAPFFEDAVVENNFAIGQEVIDEIKRQSRANVDEVSTFFAKSGDEIDEASQGGGAAAGAGQSMRIRLLELQIDFRLMRKSGLSFDTPEARAKAFNSFVQELKDFREIEKATPADNGIERELVDKINEMLAPIFCAGADGRATKEAVDAFKGEIDALALAR